MSQIIGILGFLVIALIAQFLGKYLREYFRIEDLVSSVYIYLLSFMVSLTVYGLLLFQWGSSIGVYYAFSIFSGGAIILAVVPHIFRLKREDDHQNPKERTSFWFSYPRLIGVLGSVLFFGLGFLIYQNLDYPRGFDGGWHFVHSESLLVLGTLPTYEVGTLSPPFYQRGYHMAVSALLIFIQSDVGSTLKFFNLILYSTLPLAAWFLTYVVARSKTVAGLASLSSLFLASLIIVRGGNYPMLMSLHFLALGLAFGLHVLRHKRTFDWKSLMLLPLVGLTIVATHPVTAEIYFLFGIGLLLFGFLSRIDRQHLSSALLPIYSLVMGVLLYFLLYPIFFNNQLSFALGKFSNTPINDPILASSIRTAMPEAVILFLPIFILPPVLVGILWAVRHRSLPVLSMVSVASTMVLIQILPVTGREPYILFFPMTLVAGIGLREILREHLDSIGAKTQAFVAVFLVFVVAVSGNTILQVASKPTIGPSSYLSNVEIEFASILLEEGIHGNRLATLNNPAMVRIGILSNNEVVVGDRRYTSLQHYRDIYFLLMEENCNVIWEVSAEYEINGLLLLGRWSATPTILENFDECYEDTTIIEHSGINLLLWG